LNLIKDEMKQQLRSQFNQVPTAKAYLDFINIVSSDYIATDAILQEIDHISIEDFSQMWNGLFDSFFMRGLIHGTLSKDQATELFSRISDLFLSNLKESLDINMIQHKEQHANFNGYFIYREKLTDSKNVIHAVANFYKIGENTLENIIYSHLIKELCGNIFFSELRTKHQLGYIANGKVLTVANMLYYFIYVQGSVKTPDLMDQHIEEVVTKIKDILENVDKNKFRSTLKNVLKKFNKKDPSLSSRTLRLWGEIDSGRGMYNPKKVVKEVKNKIKQSNLLKIFNKIFNDDLKKISVQEFSSQSELTSVVDVPIREGKYQPIIIENIDYFRSNNNNFFRK